MPLTSVPAFVAGSIHPRNLRNIALEGLYAYQAGALYAAGVSDRVTQALSAPRRKRPEYSSRAFPVLLLHGMAHNQSWAVKIERELEETGFIARPVNYRTLGRTIEQTGVDVAEHLRRYITATGAEQVHVVGHSLAGLALRQALLTDTALQSQVATAVTIGTPHGGTPWAHQRWSFLPFIGAMAAQLAPNSPALRRLDRDTCPSPVRWVSIWSPEDEIVPGHCGQLRHRSLNVVDVCLRGVGHAGLMFDSRAVETVVSQLIDADDAAMSATIDAWAARQTASVGT